MSSSDKREGRDPSSDRRDDGDRDSDRRDDRDRRSYRKPVVCYNCDEVGHYANQCPHRDRRVSSRPSTSSDTRRSHSPVRFARRRIYSPPKKDLELRDKVVELTRCMASIKKHFDAVQAKKAEKARRKLEREKEREEEQRRQEEEDEKKRQEELRCTEKQRKKAKKAKQEATLRAKMKKDVTLHAAMLMNEIKNDWINQWKAEVLPTLGGGRCDAKGKKKVEYVSGSDYHSGGSDDDSDTSVTQELSVKTSGLCITEKRKREEDVPMENSPPMELLPKRTPRGGTAKSYKAPMTRARSRRVRTPIPAKKKTAVKTPFSKLTKSTLKKSSPRGRLTPASRTLARLRYRDAVMHELKDCNVDELQRYCKDEGVPYVGKFDAIFNLADHRA
ncbi:hypothetical protein CBR_g5622 [Chara braunii]|uniref:CCHC-type domain-containing protein n=1 Tax=Chara braunii TaxID=69332 RepID=A0A388JRP5_CHABU|nr:hypothetical protein CBR_g5622 [Chara braunii]|eukprot:GBG60447.1 hypothetical protein CBR_g5622 [Chara braunii]